MYIVRIFSCLVLLMLWSSLWAFAQEKPPSTVNKGADHILKPVHAGSTSLYEQDGNGAGGRLLAPAKKYGHGTKIMNHHAKKDEKRRPHRISLSIDSRKDC